MFDRFWKAYPRHEGKEPARRAWRRLKPNIQLCRIMSAALERQKLSESWQRDGGRYIPMPATWLNQCRWADEQQGVLGSMLIDPDTVGPVLSKVQASDFTIKQYRAFRLRR